MLEQYRVVKRKQSRLEAQDITESPTLANEMAILDEKIDEFLVMIQVKSDNSAAVDAASVDAASVDAASLDAASLDAGHMSNLSTSTWLGCGVALNMDGGV